MISIANQLYFNQSFIVLCFLFQTLFEMSELVTIFLSLFSHFIKYIRYLIIKIKIVIINFVIFN